MELGAGSVKQCKEAATSHGTASWPILEKPCKENDAFAFCMQLQAEPLTLGLQWQLHV